MKKREFVSGSGAREFLRAELLAGVTRAKISQSATEEIKKERNRLEARKAYDAILRFLPETALSLEAKKEIDSKLIELKFLLQSLGEDL